PEYYRPGPHHPRRPCWTPGRRRGDPRRYCGRGRWRGLRLFALDPADGYQRQQQADRPTDLHRLAIRHPRPRRPVLRDALGCDRRPEQYPLEGRQTLLRDPPRLVPFLDPPHPPAVDTRPRLPPRACSLPWRVSREGPCPLPLRSCLTTPPPTP